VEINNYHLIHSQIYLKYIFFFYYRIFITPIPIIHITIEIINPNITSLPYCFSQNFSAIHHLIKLFEITAIIIVMAASVVATFPSAESTAIVWLTASTSARPDIIQSA